MTPSPSRLRLELRAQPQSAAEARRAVARLLAEVGLERAADTAVLLTSEVVTNAILHARTNVVVVVLVDPPTVRVEVSDDAGQYPEVLRADEQATSGRGMMLVDTLATAWGIRPGDGGKCVWFEVAA